MLILISPAKTLDFDTPATTKKHTQAEFLNDSAKLIQELRELEPQDISSLMSISDKLGVLNYQRFQDWDKNFDLGSGGKQAMFAFKGDVYTGLNAEQFKTAELNFAQKHLRMLSGLYGLLRPLDLMLPYRLEMGTKFANQGGKNLYEFWGNKITDKLNAELQQQSSDLLINLASNEYYKAVKPKNLQARVISPQFKDWKNGQYKIISFYAKKARGLMAAYLIQQKANTLDALYQFDLEGYYYNEELSSDDKPVFCRDEPT